MDDVRRRWYRTAAIAAVLCFFAQAGTADADGKGHRGSQCKANVEAWLQEGGVDLATVESINIERQTRNTADGNRIFQGYQAWVRTKGTDGAIVFSMRRNCDLMHSWTKGDQKFEGPGSC